MTREHRPLCDSRLGPDFEVKPGEVTMTIHVCVGFECWDDAGRRMADDAEDFANRDTPGFSGSLDSGVS